MTRRRPCAAPTVPDDPSMFGPVTQPRTVQPEPVSLYADIVLLRKAGHQVSRAGRHAHTVDGIPADDRHIRALAAAARKKTAARQVQTKPAVSLYDVLSAYSDVRVRQAERAADGGAAARVRQQPQTAPLGLAGLLRRATEALRQWRRTAA